MSTSGKPRPAASSPRCRGRPSLPRIEFYPGPAPEIPARPARDWRDAFDQFRTVLELWGRANLHENRRKGRTVLDGDLALYTANSIATARIAGREDVAALVEAAAPAPDHVSEQAIRRRIAQLRPAVPAEAGLAPWPTAKVDFVLAAFYFGGGRNRFLEAKGIALDRAVSELSVMLTTLRLEYVAAKAARSHRYRKAEERVLADKDLPVAPELDYYEPRKPSLRNQTGGRMLQYELARAVWKFSTSENGLGAMRPEERIELAYVLDVAADRIATAIRRDDSEPASLVDPSWERVPDLRVRKDRQTGEIVRLRTTEMVRPGWEADDEGEPTGELCGGSVLDQLLREEAEDLQAFEDGVGGDW